MKQQQSQSLRAGLYFPVGRLSRYARKILPKRRIGKTFPVYLAAVIEYLSAEILELAGNAARHNKKARITPRHIFLAIVNDEELHCLLNNITIPGSGVVPFIHKILLVKNKEKKKPSTSKTYKNASFSNSNLPKPKVPEPNGISEIKMCKLTVELQNCDDLVSSATNENCAAESHKLDSTNSETKIVTVVEKCLPSGQQLHVVQGDISQLAVDAIINPTNANFNMTGQIGQLLQKIGGKDFSKSISSLQKQYGSLGPTEAVLSPSFGISAKHVIHSNMFVSKDETSDELEQALRNCFYLADGKKFTSLAVPLTKNEEYVFSTHSNGLTDDSGAEIFFKTVSDYFNSRTTFVNEIFLVIISPGDIKGTLKELIKSM